MNSRLDVMTMDHALAGRIDPFTRTPIALGEPFVVCGGGCGHVYKTVTCAQLGHRCPVDGADLPQERIAPDPPDPAPPRGAAIRIRRRPTPAAAAPIDFDRFRNAPTSRAHAQTRVARPAVGRRAMSALRRGLARATDAANPVARTLWSWLKLGSWDLFEACERRPLVAAAIAVLLILLIGPGATFIALVLLAGLLGPVQSLTGSTSRTAEARPAPLSRPPIRNVANERSETA